jgi:hypothetical protein
MSTIHHLCVSVRGMLHWPPGEVRRQVLGKHPSVTKTDGSRFSSEAEFRNMLMDELAKGHEKLPMTNPPCEGFDYKTGCPGHEDTDERPTP